MDDCSFIIHLHCRQASFQDSSKHKTKQISKRCGRIASISARLSHTVSVALRAQTRNVASHGRRQIPGSLFSLVSLVNGIFFCSVALFFKNEFGFEFSAKGKMPWITLNGEDVADSHFCIEFLSKKLGINLSANYSSDENAIARAFLKLNEESLV